MNPIPSPMTGNLLDLVPAIRDHERPRPKLETLDDIIADLLQKHSRLATMLDEVEDVNSYIRLFAVYSRNAAILGRLYRDKFRFHQEQDQGDTLMNLLGQALDEVGKELGIDLG